MTLKLGFLCGSSSFFSQKFLATPKLLCVLTPGASLPHGRAAADGDDPSESEAPVCGVVFSFSPDIGAWSGCLVLGVLGVLVLGGVSFNTVGSIGCSSEGDVRSEPPGNTLGIVFLVTLSKVILRLGTFLRVF